jgi:hypothetical protein
MVNLKDKLSLIPLSMIRAKSTLVLDSGFKKSTEQLRTATAQTLDEDLLLFNAIGACKLLTSSECEMRNIQSSRSYPPTNMRKRAATR